MKSTDDVDCVMVGAFPPPLGGAAKNNLNIFNELVDRGANVIKIDTSVGTISHARSIRYHTKRVLKNIEALVSIFRSRRARVYYTVPDGGLGSIYTLSQVFLASLFFDKIFIHHRTFKYINESSGWVRLWNSISRRKATHIFLSPGMQAGFEKNYGAVAGRVASNAYFVADEVKSTSSNVDIQNRRFRLGHLSNLCREKGFFFVARAFEACLKQSLPVELHLAGPIIEEEIRIELERLTEQYPDTVTYVGKVAGGMKNDFYGQIDLFLFPTQFSQEAQPNVLYEAFAAGVPVSTVDRACIPEMVGPNEGIISTTDEYAIRTAEYARLLMQRGAYEVASQRESIRSGLQKHIDESVIAYESIFAELT